MKPRMIRPEPPTPTSEPASLTIHLGRTGSPISFRNVGLIFAYEYKKRVTQKSFIIMTIIMLLLIVLASCVPMLLQYITSMSAVQTKITILNHAGTIAGLDNEGLLRSAETILNGQATQTSPSGQATTEASPRFSVSIAQADRLDSLKQQVRAGLLSMLLVIDRTTTQELHFTYYNNANPINDSNAPQMQSLTRQISLLDRSTRLGLSMEQTGKLFAPPELSTVNVGQAQKSRSIADLIAGYILAYIGVILIFTSVYLYGYGVTMGVAEEKGSRIMEILVNAATPLQLMVGKILGIGAAGLSQMAAFVVVGIGALLLQQPIQTALLGTMTNGLSLNITAPSISMLLLLLLLLLYFLLGFLLYATLFAAAGALVKRQEEAQNAIQPLMWLFLVGYMVSFFGISTPDATWIKVISYIPFWSPTTMLMRIGVGAVAWWEILLTVLLMLVATALCAMLSARIYRLGVLMYGQKSALKQLLTLVHMK